MWLLLSGTAAAADCPDVYALNTLLGDVGRVEESLDAGDQGTAATFARRVEEGLPCLEVSLPAVLGARTLRAVGAGLAFGNPGDPGSAWLITAAVLDSTFRYDPDALSFQSPVVLAWQDARQRAAAAPITSAKGRVILGVRAWVDGQPVSDLTLVEGIPHLVQRSVDGNDVVGATIVGSALPADWAPPDWPRTTEVPSPLASPSPTPDPVGAASSGRQWPAQRVALVAGGATGVVGSAMLYGLSAGSERRFQAAKDLAEIDRYRASTNRLVLASGASLGAGVSALGIGMLFGVLDGDPAPTLDVRF